MRFGIQTFLTDRSMSPGRLAREVEARGFDSMFMAEHTHIPSARATPAPLGEPLPEQYWRCLDPFVALTAAALAAPKLRVGTAIALVAQRDEIVTAKEVATIDHLTEGRFTFGVGFGWNKEEIEDHGVAYGRRRDVTREKMLAMRQLWEQEEASFEGEFVRLSPSKAWPKPVQDPLPVLVGGGAGPKLFSHIAEYAQGWMPIGGRGVAAALPELHAACEKAGRDPSSLMIVPVGTDPKPPEKLERFQSLGVYEIVLGLPYGLSEDETLRILDGYVKATEPFRDGSPAPPL
ncbi:MAG TPA: TIGR03619 family F420-dependent LLM class oxidoreductase [Actinomycetota bacterium]|nr:TIGR03619 family F420-dependent LLM class oxidoreductase [Actinomycetota bacterium]